MTRAARAGWRNLGLTDALRILATMALLAATAIITWGCAGMVPGKITPAGAVDAGYQAIVVYHRTIGGAVERDAISSATAFKLIAEGDRVRADVVDKARDALLLCGAAATSCPSVDVILKDLGPRLAELERRLRAEEAAKK